MLVSVTQELKSWDRSAPVEAVSSQWTPRMILGVLAGLLTGLGLWRLATWTRRWGATSDEADRRLPGDEVAPGSSCTTYAIDIAAPPEQVWPWLLQIGRGRAGFYTYTWIENLLGADIHNLDHIEPTLQRLEPGDRIWMTPERYLGRLRGQFWRVRRIEPGHAIVLERQPPDSPVAASWTLLVEPAGEGGTRLIDRHRGERSPGPLGRVTDALWLAGTLLMERGMLRGIRARAEMHHGGTMALQG